MKIIKVIVFLGMLSILSFNTNAQHKFSYSQELWQELNLCYSLNHKWSVDLLFNNMTDMNRGNVDWFIESGIKHNLLSNLFIEFIYRKEYFKVGSIWKHEDRLTNRFGWNSTIGQWNIRNRHRIEYRFIEDMPVKYRYRTDIKLSPPYTFSKWKCKPFLQEEVFVQKQKMTKLRTYIGVEGAINGWEPSFYTLVQSYNIPQGYNHVLVFGVFIGYKI